MHKNLTDEALCVKAAQDDLERYLRSLDLKEKGPVFTGHSWDVALRRFESYWEVNCICDYCHHITEVLNVVATNYECRKCRKGRYTTRPKRIWDMVLKHEPRRQHYFTINDAFGLIESDINEFKKHNPYGFLVKSSKSLMSNSVIRNFDTIYRKTLELHRDGFSGHVYVDSPGKSIIKLRKRKDSQHPLKILMGRSADNDIVFYNGDISRYHAFLYLKPLEQGYFLVDLGSENGTFINGKKIRPNHGYSLNDGFQIRFGPKTTVIYFSPEGFYEFFKKVSLKAAS